MNGVAFLKKPPAARHDIIILFCHLCGIAVHGLSVSAGNGISNAGAKAKTRAET